MDSKYELLLKRRHEQLKAREWIHGLIYDSYAGGINYRKGGYLHQHTLECNEDYGKRKERSIYINHCKGLIDILTGYIFSTPVQRSVAPEINYILEKANPSYSLDAFIKHVATLASLSTICILVDSPQFDPEEIKTIDQRQAQGLNPYCKIYLPDQIRDFSLGKDNKLNWILLDDSYEDDTDPFKKNTLNFVRTLWTKTEIRKYYFRKDEKGDYVFSREERIPLMLNEIPIILFNLMDSEKSFNSSYAEDLALLDNAIYNYFSLLDCSLVKQAIKPLFFPSKDGSLPDELLKVGEFAKLIAIPFPNDASHEPFYLEQSSNNDVTSYILTINILLDEARQSIGLSKDNSLSGQSGKAKSYELKKLESILKSACSNLQSLEMDILRLVSAWEKKESKCDVTYSAKFNDDDLEILLKALYDLLTIDSTTLKELAVERIVQTTIPEVSQDNVKKILNEVKNNPVLPDQEVPGFDNQSSDATKINHTTLA
jgi:hypothetical protein